jgi:hypothetical protein
MPTSKTKKPVLGAAFGQGGKFPTIGVVNDATVDLGAPLKDLVAALQQFLNKHFVPVWGYPATLKIYPSVDKVPKDEWIFLFIDDADAAGALGYHDVTKNGQPVSKIFVKTTQQAGEVVSVTACHELAEMLIDPGAQLWAQNLADNSFWAYEMSDAVEEQTFDVNGIPMSNFVFPAYFESWKHAKGTKFDYLGKLTKPFSLSRGGYAIVCKDGKTDNIFGSEAKARRFQKEDRRMHRSEYRKPCRD